MASKVCWALVIFSGILLAAARLFQVSADPDLWWHLKAGMDHLQSGEMARIDRFSYTFPGVSWTNHEWLSEFLFAWVFLKAGDTGLFFLRALLFSGTLAGLMILCALRWPRPLVPLLAGLAAAPYLSIFMNVRPHSFTYFFLILFLLCLESSRRGNRKALWLFIPLMMVWTNLHGGFILGLAVAATAFVEVYFRRKKPEIFPAVQDAGSSPGPAGLVLILTLAATLVNPYGWKLYLYLAKEVTTAHREITEWQRLGGGQLWHYTLFVLAPFAALWRSKRPHRPAELVLYFVFAAAALLRGRLLILLIFFSILVFVDALREPLNRWLERRKQSGSRRWGEEIYVAAVSVALILPSAMGIVQGWRGSGFHVKVDPSVYPVHAADYLKENFLGPNLLLTFQWGGYALWHLSPDYRVSIDGRNVTVYPADYVENYIAAYNEGDFEGFRGRVPADVILIESRGKMYESLRARSDWVEGYHDKTAAVFVPKGSRPGPVGRPGTVGNVLGA